MYDDMQINLTWLFHVCFCKSCISSSQFFAAHTLVFSLVRYSMSLRCTPPTTTTTTTANTIDHNHHDDHYDHHDDRDDEHHDDNHSMESDTDSLTSITYHGDHDNHNPPYIFNLVSDDDTDNDSKCWPS